MPEQTSSPYWQLQEPLRCTQWQILEAMDRYGGSFVQQLARLYRLADIDNQRILVTAFAHYFRRYDEMAAAYLAAVEGRE